MAKDNRLSFRISDHLSERVDSAIDNSGGQIRDRSEFGTKAVKYYLDYIDNQKSEKELMLEAIVALASKVGESGDSVKKTKTYLENTSLVPDFLSSRKDPQSHPEFDKLLALLERFDDGPEKKELSQTIRDAAYDEVEKIYRDWTDKFFLMAKKA